MSAPSSMFRILGAFLVRDAKRELSYPMTVALSLFGMLFQVALWYYTAQFVGPTLPAGSVVGGDYFSFIIFGFAWIQYLQVSLFSFASNLREEQLAGTLEMLLATPEREERLILSLSAWDYLWQTFLIAGYLVIATLFGVRWNAGGGWAPGAAIFVLTLVVYVGIGLVAAAYTIAFKKGTAVAIAAASLTTIFGGVLFPPEILGPRLSLVSKIVPASYVNHGLRTALLAGGGWRDVSGDLLALVIFAIAVFPLGIWLFRRAVRGARQRGDLTGY